MTSIKRILLFGTITFAIACVLLAKLPQSVPAKYQPKEVETLRLQVKQGDAKLAYQQLQAAQQNYQNAMLALQAEGERVKKDEGWDASVLFDPNTLHFEDAPPKQAAPPVGKKP